MKLNQDELIQKLAKILAHSNDIKFITDIANRIAADEGEDGLIPIVSYDNKTKMFEVDE